jgi:hypothetical protein
MTRDLRETLEKRKNNGGGERRIRENNTKKDYI